MSTSNTILTAQSGALRLIGYAEEQLRDGFEDKPMVIDPGFTDYIRELAITVDSLNAADKILLEAMRNHGEFSGNGIRTYGRISETRALVLDRLDRLDPDAQYRR